MIWVVEKPPATNFERGREKIKAKKERTIKERMSKLITVEAIRLASLGSL
jgi:hypothetical protein